MQRNEQKPDLLYTLKLKTQGSIRANTLKRECRTDVTEIRFRENVTRNRTIVSTTNLNTVSYSRLTRETVHSIAQEDKILLQHTQFIKIQHSI